jgi:5-methylcytosine-specific restriction endonuclease McrA|nr:MAG TPA: HNHc [Caudoviricetes sp.]
MDKHEIIFNYWKDKCITSKGTVETMDKYDFSNSIQVITDWGEPECWLCGKLVDLYDYSFYSEALKNGNYNEIWSHSKVKNKLNRCHIIPKALGGNDTADNLFLLCNECHSKSPDTSNPKYFLQYVYNERKNFYFDGVNISNIFNEYLNLCIKYKKDARTLDMKNNDLKTNTHGPFLSESTLIYKMIDSTKDYEADDLNEYIKYIETLKKIILKNRRQF